MNAVVSPLKGNCSICTPNFRVQSADIMSSAQTYQTHRLPRIFTLSTPMHHPLEDPNLPEDDVALVPRDLAPRGGLSWELPKKTVTDLNIRLKLTDETDRLLDEFHQTIPRIDEILSEWMDMRGLSSAATGEKTLRAQARRHLADYGIEESRGKIQQENLVFNMVRHLNTPGRADVMYLTDTVDDSGLSESPTPNIRALDFVGFDDSYVHLSGNGSDIEDSNPKDLSSFSAESNHTGSTPSNLGTQAEDYDQDYCLAASIYDPSEVDKDKACSRQLGCYEAFWRDYAYPYSEVVLNRNSYCELT